MKTRICFIYVMALITNGVLGQGSLLNGVVSYWKLDETSGSITDAAEEHTGTNYGAIMGQTGIINTACSFDATNDYISIPNAEDINIQTDSISLSAWIYPTSAKTQMIISKIHALGTHVAPYFQYNLQLYYSGTRLFPRFYLSLGGTASYTANTTYNLSLNQWYHVVGTYDGTTMRLYLNGTEIATTTASGNITGYSTPVYIGINGAQGEAYGGLIDETGIWNRALSLAEVTSLYNSGAGLSYPFGESAEEETPTGYWQSQGDTLYYNAGKVGIGTSSPTATLTVNGTIFAKEIEVNSSIISDFVFEPEYELMPLTELEIYLRKYNHLPGIPSAEDFLHKGQDLGETDDMLLRKIEELTLYIIELKKEIEVLKRKK